MKKTSGMLILLAAFSLAASAQSAQEWNKKGLEQMKKYEFKAAYESFSKAIEMKVDFGEAYANRGEAWFNLPAGTYPNTDGCADFRKARELGFKVSKDKLAGFGCN